MCAGIIRMVINTDLNEECMKLNIYVIWSIKYY